MDVLLDLRIIEMLGVDLELEGYAALSAVVEHSGNLIVPVAAGAVGKKLVEQTGKVRTAALKVTTVSFVAAAALEGFWGSLLQLLRRLSQVTHVVQKFVYSFHVKSVEKFVNILFAEIVAPRLPII